MGEAAELVPEVVDHLAFLFRASWSLSLASASAACAPRGPMSSDEDDEGRPLLLHGRRVDLLDRAGEGVVRHRDVEAALYGVGGSRHFVRRPRNTATGSGDEATVGTPPGEGTVEISSELGTENAMLLGGCTSCRWCAMAVSSYG